MTSVSVLLDNRGRLPFEPPDMPDPRPITPQSDSDARRESKIEHLLLAGLDQYFSGDVERAIGTWTRVLFLDRGHQRARAYIERARGALAERLRESEELVHRGAAAFDRGEIREARRLLISGLDRGGPQDVALAYLERIERLEAPEAEPGRTQAGPTPRRRLHRPSRGGRSASRRIRWGVPVAVAAILVALGAYALVAWPGLDTWTERRGGPAAERGTEGPAAAALPVPPPGDLALTRARALAAQGRVREALRLLDQVPLADVAQTDVDRLRADLQRALLGRESPSTPAPAPGPLGSPR